MCQKKGKNTRAEFGQILLVLRLTTVTSHDSRVTSRRVDTTRESRVETRESILESRESILESRESILECFLPNAAAHAERTSFYVEESECEKMKMQGSPHSGLSEV